MVSIDIELNETTFVFNDFRMKVGDSYKQDKEVVVINKDMYIRTIDTDTVTCLPTTTFTKITETNLQNVPFSIQPISTDNVNGWLPPTRSIWLKKECDMVNGAWALFYIPNAMDIWALCFTGSFTDDDVYTGIPVLAATSRAYMLFYEVQINPTINIWNIRKMTCPNEECVMCTPSPTSPSPPLSTSFPSLLPSISTESSTTTTTTTTATTTTTTTDTSPTTVPTLPNKDVLPGLFEIGGQGIGAGKSTSGHCLFIHGWGIDPNKQTILYHIYWTAFYAEVEQLCGSYSFPMFDTIHYAANSTYLINAMYEAAAPYACLPLNSTGCPHRIFAHSMGGLVLTNACVLYGKCVKWIALAVPFIGVDAADILTHVCPTYFGGFGLYYNFLTTTGAMFFKQTFDYCGYPSLLTMMTCHYPEFTNTLCANPIEAYNILKPYVRGAICGDSSASLNPSLVQTTFATFLYQTLTTATITLVRSMIFTQTPFFPRPDPLLGSQTFHSTANDGLINVESCKWIEKDDSKWDDIPTSPFYTTKLNHADIMGHVKSSPFTTFPGDFTPQSGPDRDSNGYIRAMIAWDGY